MAQATGRSIEVKSASSPDEVRQFQGKGHMDVFHVGDHTVGTVTFEPGWKWSENVKPIAKTDRCQGSHLAYVVSGRMKIVHDDGTEVEVGPGDLMSVKPGHDAWVLGDEPCIQVDFKSAETYAKA
jgi:quercetin dioxygenase-like cupin family protein